MDAKRKVDEKTLAIDQTIVINTNITCFGRLALLKLATVKIVAGEIKSNSVSLSGGHMSPGEIMPGQIAPFSPSTHI